jgi:MarR family transcriptional regulator, lower aerobic nicotinate degradation pathway regulator
MEGSREYTCGVARSPAVDRSPHCSGALLDHLARRLRLRAESVLAPLGLRPRHLVALTVLRSCSGCTQQAFSMTLEMDGTNVVGLLNELETEKLIERRRSPEDRRRHVVDLTDAGVERLAKAEAALAAAEGEVLGALDDDQRETLYHLLQQAVTGGTVTCVDEPGDSC